MEQASHCAHSMNAFVTVKQFCLNIPIYQKYKCYPAHRANLLAGLKVKKYMYIYDFYWHGNLHSCLGGVSAGHCPGSSGSSGSLFLSVTVV